MNYFKVELKRALKEKRILYLIIFLVIMSVLSPMPSFMQKQIAYWHDTKNIQLGINPVDVWMDFIGRSRLMTTFIVLFPILVYSHSIVDDLQYKYINNILLKVSFKVYYKTKLLVCMILGGSIYFITSILCFGLSCIIYGGKESILYGGHYTFSLFGNEIVFGNSIIYLIFISFILFILGSIYAAIGFFIGLYTDNKMLVYSISVLSLSMYDEIVYLISQLMGSRANSFCNTFSIFSGSGGYNSEKVIIINLILFIIILSVMSSKIKKIERNLLNS
ncbi:hypothetical protein [Inconstantimicrobium mannanitabidum]|uniref:Uncharacterized protein n=1 Tax=Inconstantimicrobium mannanitabidum TaxID=1604901 RepID=A0ACB5RIF2_9CLOT|nr:hypothetical protein [Clostridium sp. TW13]GKX68911.1 hypothetical protein rsdtw13_41690 [Clostridium sp. TW13]